MCLSFVFTGSGRQNIWNDGGGSEYRIAVLIVGLEKFERLWFPDKRELSEETSLNSFV